MQDFKVTPFELFSQNENLVCLGYSEVKIGKGQLYAELNRSELDFWWNVKEGKIEDGYGVLDIEILEVRHLRVQTLSEEVLQKLGYKHWSSMTDRFGIKSDSEITIIFFRRELP